MHIFLFLWCTIHKLMHSKNWSITNNDTTCLCCVCVVCIDSNIDWICWMEDWLVVLTVFRSAWQEPIFESMDWICDLKWKKVFPFKSNNFAMNANEVITAFEILSFITTSCFTEWAVFSSSGILQVWLKLNGALTGHSSCPLGLYQLHN